MTILKNKKFRILIILIVIVFFSPFAKFKAYMNIHTHDRTNNGGSNHETKIKDSETGFFFNKKVTRLDNDVKIKVLESRTLYLGLYSKMSKKISFKRVIENDTIKTDINAESIILGLGKMSIRKNNFNKFIKIEMDKVFAKKETY